MRDYGCRLRGLIGRNSGVTPPTKSPSITDKRSPFIRGGGWGGNYATLVRAAFRIGFAPADRNGYRGFRCTKRGCRQSVDRA